MHGFMISMHNIPMSLCNVIACQKLLNISRTKQAKILGILFGHMHFDIFFTIQTKKME